MTIYEMIIATIGLSIVLMLGAIVHAIKGINPVVRVHQITVPEKPTVDDAETKKIKQKKEPLGTRHLTQHLEEKPKEIQKKEPPKKYGEIWKPLVEPQPVKKSPIEKGRYMVSNMGRIWDIAVETLVEAHMQGIDYKVCLHCGNGLTYRLVKMLVATTFIGVQNTTNYKVVNNDGNPKNCAASNLRWERTKKGSKPKTVWTTGGYR